MQYLNTLESWKSDKATAVTLGKFDGLHRGHQKLVEQIGRYRSDKVAGIICAFDMGRDSLLTSAQRKRRLEGKADCLIECAFTREIREMTAEQFIDEILVKRLRAAYIVVGIDFCFGYQKRGNIDVLNDYSGRYGYHLDVIEKEQYQGREISSTYIREELEKGNVDTAAKLLGYRYETEGVVIHGRRLGRRLGFPTMNILWEEKKIAPRFGVYACEVQIDGKAYRGICNVGIKPTVSDEAKLLTEVYVFDYDEDAYGKKISVRFCEFERPEKRFDSVEQLKAQVEQDIRYGKAYFS